MTAAVHVSKRVLHEQEAGRPIDVLILEPAKPRRSAVFAVGAGGDPERHLPLLTSLAASGCKVAAPHLGRLTSPAPSVVELARRARALQLAFDEILETEFQAVGIGHSIGGALMLMLAGAQASTIAGEAVSIAPDPRLNKLALMAPALDFFRAPGALEGVQASICVWAGGKDEITPPAGLELLAQALNGGAAPDLRIVADAGHFSFMNSPPPHATEPLKNRDDFLDRLAEEVATFVND